MDRVTRFDAAPILTGLKDFQRRTVDYAFERLYAEDGSGRFLVADEVGLGKTLVARGVIARTLEMLWEHKERIDIIYVCSNATIAEQNVRRLNVLGSDRFAIANRLTLLPETVHTLSDNHVNFISLTPGTTFNLRSSTGTARERVLLYHMLRDGGVVDGRGLKNLLQCGVQKRERWTARLKSGPDHIDSGLAQAFVDAVSSDNRLMEQVEAGCHAFRNQPTPRSQVQRQTRDELVGDLRQLLAQVCLGALRPSLVVLDEFQRFNTLLAGDTEEAELAQQLFRLKGSRLLLLSATPYRMLTMHGESEDDHHADFLSTLAFLGDSPDEADAVRNDLEQYRQAFRKLAEGDEGAVTQARDDLQSRLLQVMCRTERVGLTRKRDSMMESYPQELGLQPDDLDYARSVDRAAHSAGVRDTIEYWKSVPYMLSYMRDYQLRRKIDGISDKPPKALRAAISEPLETGSLSETEINGYKQLSMSHPRIRAFIEETVGLGLWELLWLPPSLHYTRPEGPWATVGQPTKQLVFSAWNAVPDAIATLVSYEAQRLSFGEAGQEIGYKAIYERIRPLLRFHRDSQGRLAGMPALIRILPTPRLSREIDPLRLALELGGDQAPSLDAVVGEATARCAELIKTLPAGEPGQRPDERWYWAAPALIEADPEMKAWIEDDAGWSGIFPERESRGNFEEHKAELLEAMRGNIGLGPQPADLAEVVARIALGSTGACSLRALKRIAPDLGWTDPALLSAAARAANGFRTLFNLPESIVVIQKRGNQPFWREALDYALNGNLQAVLDEHVHMLPEQLGLTGAPAAERVTSVAEALSEGLSMRSSQLKVDELRVVGRKVKQSEFQMRCRFALRFGNLKDDRNEAIARADHVRAAFNSPFRPFVLASTSVGQEGLDFHTWCHSVVHWNLPSNPVDMEQREGRVHRYKGHAVRRNVAHQLGLGALKEWRGKEDPWTYLFKLSEQTEESKSSDLAPYWVYEAGPAAIERRVLMLPMSRDAEKLRRMKRALALYRLVFGQPRQEDLIAYLDQNLSEGITLSDDWQISLLPPG